MQKIDILIVGGGLSGLYAAWRLQQLDIPYLLLEAKSFLGGRISSKPSVENADLGVDLGPTWFWPHQNRMQELLKELNVSCFEQYTAGDVLYQMRSDQAPSRAAGVGVMQSYRVLGGMQKLIAALSERLEAAGIKTEHPVSHLAKVAGQWNVSVLQNGNQCSFQAEQLMLALPPRIISSTPGLSEILSGGLIAKLSQQQTWMSAQAKFVAVYKKPFWREKGLAGQAFSQVGPMQEIHDASSAPDAGYALFGFLGTPWTARQYISAAQLENKCLAQLVHIFGQQAAEPDVTYLTDWAKDRWVATEQDRLESPRHADFLIDQFSQELNTLKLHLVASEFSQFEAGYLEGALIAVDQTIARLKA
jgi:monoamine oxidase